jgi:hypothetical protein
VVTGISAVEVQAVEPDTVAARWSDIVEIALQRDGDGHAQIELDNATVRFVPAVDGRGDGLAGVELLAVDPGSALTAARQRGLVDGAGVVTIAGTRFSLRDTKMISPKEESG